MPKKRLLYFSAPWCGPCKTFAPTLKRVEALIPVERHDVEESPELAETYNVQSLPTLVLLNDGQPADWLVGVHPFDQIVAQFNL